MQPTTPIGSRTTSELPTVCSQVKSSATWAAVRERVEGQADLDELGEEPRHAHLVGDEVGQDVGAFGERLADCGQHRGPLCDRRRRPRAGKAARGRGHRPVDVVDRPVGDGADDLLGGRVDDVDGARSRGRDPLPSDVQLVPDDGLERFHDPPLVLWSGTLVLCSRTRSTDAPTVGRTPHAGIPVTCVTLPIYSVASRGSVRRPDDPRSDGGTCPRRSRSARPRRARGCLPQPPSSSPTRASTRCRSTRSAEAAGRTSGAVYAHFGSQTGTPAGAPRLLAGLAAHGAAGRGGGERLAGRPTGRRVDQPRRRRPEARPPPGRCSSTSSGSGRHGIPRWPRCSACAMPRPCSTAPASWQGWTAAVGAHPSTTPTDLAVLVKALLTGLAMQRRLDPDSVPDDARLRGLAALVGLPLDAESGSAARRSSRSIPSPTTPIEEPRQCTLRSATRSASSSRSSPSPTAATWSPRSPTQAGSASSVPSASLPTSSRSS